MAINICLSCIWTHQGHVVERGNQVTIVQQAQVNILLELKVAGTSSFFTSPGCFW